MGDKSAPASSERLESRKRSKRGEVFGLVCFRFGLAPAGLAALSDDALRKCFVETTGRAADVAILRRAAGEYAAAHPGDGPVWLTLRSTNPAAPPARPEPHPAASSAPVVSLRLNTVTRLEELAEEFRGRGVFLPVWPASVGVTREG